MSYNSGRQFLCGTLVAFAAITFAQPVSGTFSIEAVEHLPAYDSGLVDGNFSGAQYYDYAFEPSVSGNSAKLDGGYFFEWRTEGTWAPSFSPSAKFEYDLKWVPGAPMSSPPSSFTVSYTMRFLLHGEDSQDPKTYAYVDGGYHPSGGSGYAQINAFFANNSFSLREDAPDFGSLGPEDNVEYGGSLTFTRNTGNGNYYASPQFTLSHVAIMQLNQVDTTIFSTDPFIMGAVDCLMYIRVLGGQTFNP